MGFVGISVGGGHHGMLHILLLLLVLVVALVTIVWFGGVVVVGSCSKAVLVNTIKKCGSLHKYVYTNTCTHLRNFSQVQSSTTTTTTSWVL